MAMSDMIPVKNPFFFIRCPLIKTWPSQTLASIYGAAQDLTAHGPPYLAIGSGSVFIIHYITLLLLWQDISSTNSAHSTGLFPMFMRELQRPGCVVALFNGWSITDLPKRRTLHTVLAILCATSKLFMSTISPHAWHLPPSRL